MSPNTAQEWRLTDLNQLIDRLQAETAELEAEHSALVKAARRGQWRLAYVRAARSARAPGRSVALWPVALLTIGPLVAGIFLLLLADLLLGSLALAVFAFLLGAAAAVAAIALLLYRPADAVLPAAIEAATAAQQLSAARLQELAERIASTQRQQRKLIEERRDLMASGKVQRAALLQRQWKAMPEAEWEDFVVEVCRTLGASVDRLPRSAEKGADLLADFGNRRVAIVISGEGHVVNSAAVQNALAGQKRHGCDRSAVIINRRLTGAAQDFARHNGCTTIGLDEFPDFVLGKLEL